MESLAVLEEESNNIHREYTEQNKQLALLLEEGKQENQSIKKEELPSKNRNPSRPNRQN